MWRHIIIDENLFFNSLFVFETEKGEKRQTIGALWNWQKSNSKQTNKQNLILNVTSLDSGPENSTF